MGNTAKIISHKNSTLDGNEIKRIQWGSSGLPAPPGKPILIPSFTEDSQPIIIGIRWERSEYNGGSAIIGYLVEHRRLGSPHWVKSSPGLCTFPELTLSGLEPGWRYQFRVRAQNAVGLSQPSQLSDPLTVTLQRAAVSPPKFTLELKDTTALENEQVEFVVHFSGTPIPKISWFKDGFEIFSSRRTKIITENGKSSLLIHQTALNDEGEIKCTASNRAGHVTTRANLILEALPKIRLPRQYEDGLLFEKGETIKLKILIAGRPLPQVIWYHDGTILNTNTNQHLIESIDGGEYSLTIVAAVRQDRGEYTVKAVNKLGEDVASFLLTVTDRPSIPGRITIAMTLGRSVSLSWSEPEDDGGCKIGTYIVEYYRIGWDVWLKASTCRQACITLGDLIGDSEYKFRVKAENPYGVSEPSEESDVIFIPQARDRSVALTPSLDRPQEMNYLGQELEKPSSYYNNSKASKPRSRSLTRDEKTCNYLETIGSTKPARSDSRVTFAETVYHLEESFEAQTKPPRSKRDRLLNTNNQKNHDNDLDIPETLSIYNADDRNLRGNNYFESTVPPTPSSHSDNTETINIPQTQSSQDVYNEQLFYDEDDKDNKANDEEFMLVLYPGDKNYRAQSHDNIESNKNDDFDDDLVPPPMSRSLPELVSTNHRIVDVIRSAFSSTELLHERALEKFYRAVAIEEKGQARKNGSTTKKVKEQLSDNNIVNLLINSNSHPTTTSHIGSQTEIFDNATGNNNNDNNNMKLGKSDYKLYPVDDSSVVQLKSILKKRSDELPPVKSVFEKGLDDLNVDNNDTSITNEEDELSEKMSGSDGESDSYTNLNLMNVAEVAKNRRKLSTKHQIEQKTSLPVPIDNENIKKEIIEAERALIDHYTEIVREHSINMSTNFNRQKSPIKSSTESTRTIQASDNSADRREGSYSTFDRIYGSQSNQPESKNGNERPTTEAKTHMDNGKAPVGKLRSKVEIGNSSRESSMSRSSSKTRKKRRRESIKPNEKLQFSDSKKIQHQQVTAKDEIFLTTISTNRNREEYSPAVETRLKVQSAMSYTTDVILFLGALYVYLFKKEIFALPFIGLILYRRIQANLLNWTRH